MISSANNAQIKNINKLLKSAKERRETGSFVVEGIKMFEEARKLGLIRKAFFSDELHEEWKIVNKEALNELDYEVVTDKVFREIADTVTPQGVMGVCSVKSCTIEEFISKPACRLLFLEDIRDPGNFGTMIRTAEGTGVTGIVLSKESVDIYNPKVVRSTMGSIFRVPHVYVDDFPGTIRKAQLEGVIFYATHLNGNQEYDNVDYAKKAAFIVGNEARGISDAVAEKADQLIRIPMCGQVESLNAAVAAAVMLYEVYRQERREN
ncbi:TrmH family RNA methyltransferase [Anaeromicropila populeti]|uniref:RNA methyltransferase, TrmH family n=1 Tax=Anaeromicropila populeti TaxID=37658 RepID=A0A1I6JZF7_9FIRM|nr:RNA methyltransferase [Anaeromicropila populeti]SFR84372.1 RNA methyltransferase, TrmH family [Anaeromicropila populeti]